MPTMFSSVPQRLLLHRVIQTISRYEMLRPGDCLGLAVSGGADSTALLRVFAELRSELGITLRVLHFHHGLRGAEADADEAFVRRLASSNSLPCIVERANAAAIARRERWNIEDAGRRLRYAFFQKLVASKQVTRVATAHTADDQAETVLARIMRGAGIAGLCAIEPVRGGVIRPLLDVRRSELRAYLSARKQSWREDTTNRDTRRLRARIRERLMPNLESEFSRGIVEKLAALAELAQEDESFWSALVRERCGRLISPTGEAFDIAAGDLLAPLGVQLASNVQNGLAQRIVRQMHAELNATGQLSREHVRAVMRFAAEKHSGKRLELPGMSVSRDSGRLRFQKNAAGQRRGSGTKAPAYAYPVELPRSGASIISVGEIGRSFRLKFLDRPFAKQDVHSSSEQGAVLDAEQLHGPLLLRNWKPGDAYLPAGRHQAHTLARLLQAVGIGGTAKAVWPVLMCGNEVAWAARLPAAARFCARQGTHRALWISEVC